LPVSRLRGTAGATRRPLRSRSACRQRLRQRLSAPITTGTVTHYTGTGISDPTAITSGPLGALWFSNGNSSVGEISTGGVVNTFRGGGTRPQPGGTVADSNVLWFTNYGSTLMGDAVVAVHGG
jgi:streptogramin lyase